MAVLVASLCYASVAAQPALRRRPAAAVAAALIGACMMNDYLSSSDAQGSAPPAVEPEPAAPPADDDWGFPVEPGTNMATFTASLALPSAGASICNALYTNMNRKHIDVQYHVQPFARVV